MRMLFRSLSALVCSGACLSAAAEGGAAPGLQANATEAFWPRWQARLLVTPAASPWWRAVGADEAEGAPPRVASLSVLGDYFFVDRSTGGLGWEGFRATSGLIHGTASHHSLASPGLLSQSRGLRLPMAPWAGSLRDGPTTVPYLGLGYTAGSLRGGWGFSADIGMVARSPASAVKFGRMLGGTQALDELLREMRLSPMLNVGVSYAF